jgi:hypothetical protein
MTTETIFIDENTFAAACVDQNSIAELRAAMDEEQPDEADMKNWGIGPEQWRESIALAISAKAQRDGNP